MNKTDRAMLQLCDDVIVLDSEEDEAPSLADMARRAKEIVASFTKAKRARTARQKALPGHPATLDADKRKDEKKQQKRAETADLRIRALDRAGGRGELCGVLFMWNERPEMAHLNGGNGKRLQDQRLENVVMEHHGCHQGREGIDTVPLEWLPEVKAHCAKYGYPVPRRFVKLEALKGAKETP